MFAEDRCWTWEIFRGPVYAIEAYSNRVRRAHLEFDCIWPFYRPVAYYWRLNLDPNFPVAWDCVAFGIVSLWQRTCHSLHKMIPWYCFGFRAFSTFSCVKPVVYLCLCMVGRAPCPLNFKIQWLFRSILLHTGYSARGSCVCVYMCIHSLSWFIANFCSWNEKRKKKNKTNEKILY